MIEQLLTILNQDLRFLIKARSSASKLAANTLQVVYVKEESLASSWSILNKDCHQIQATFNDQFTVLSYLKPIDEAFVFQSGMFQSVFDRLTKGVVTTSRFLYLEEVCNYIAQLELIDRAIIEHFDRSQDSITLDEIAEALTVEYILNWKPL